MSDARVPVICECGDHCFALATRGLVILVSPEDAHLLQDHRWAVALRQWGLGVAIRSSIGGRKVILARLILGAVDGELADHKFGDTLDHRRPNLRLCNHLQNSVNRCRTRGKQLPKGVYWSRGRYRAMIKRAGRLLSLGCYASPEEAAEVYRAKARELYGDFARAD